MKTSAILVLRRHSGSEDGLGAMIQAMYQFAIDMGEENSYSTAAPQGVVVAGSSLKTSS